MARTEALPAARTIILNVIASAVRASAHVIDVNLARRAPLQALQLDFRHDKTECGPTTGLDGALEPSTRAGRVTSQQIPVTDAITQCRYIHVTRIRGGNDLLRWQLTTIQLQSFTIRIGGRQRIR